MWSAITVIIFLLIALIAYSIFEFRRHLTPSTGKKIDLSKRPNSALLIVDLQDDFTKATGKNSYAPELVDNFITAINKLVDTANKNGAPVISVRQTFRGWFMNTLFKLVNKGRGTQCSTGLDLDDRVNGDIDHDIIKSRADSFSEPELDRVLDSQNVGKLIIVGLDGDFCVNATMRSALNRGYEVAFSDATTLALNPDSWKKTRAKLIAGGASDTIPQSRDQTDLSTDLSADPQDLPDQNDKRETA